MRFHMASFISSDPVWLAMSPLTLSRLRCMVFHSSLCSLSYIPLYAIAWVSPGSLAPWRLKWFGMFNGITSISFLFTPSFTNLLLCSFPSSSLWPFTHLNLVGAVRRLSRNAACLNHSLFFIPIHPWFSQVFRCFVSPSITYLESIFIISEV